MGSATTVDASKVALGSVHLALQNAISTVVGVVGLAFLARAISQEVVGTLAAITLLSSLIQLFSDFGLSASLAKHVSELRGRGEDISAHFVGSLTVKAPVAIPLCLVLSVFSEGASSALFGTTSRFQLVRLVAMDAFLIALLQILNSVLLGSGRLKAMAVCGVSSAVARWLAILLLVWTGYGLQGAVTGWIIGDLIGLVFYGLSSMRLVTFKDDLLSKSIGLIPELLKFSWPLFTASMVSFLYSWYDRALVLVFLPLTDLGMYDVSYRAFAVLASMASVLDQALFPYYGMAYGRKDHKAISIGIKGASRYTMMIIFPLTLGLLSTAKPVITLFAGQQYEIGWPILAILSIFGLTYGIFPAFSSLLLIYEKTKTLLLLSLVPVASSLAFLPLLSILGLSGLALIRGVSLLATFLLTVYFLSKIVKVEIDKQTSAKAFASSAVMMATVLAVQQIHYDKFLLPAYVLIGATVYLTGMRLLRILNKADIQLLKRALGEKMAIHVAKMLGEHGQD